MCERLWGVRRAPIWYGQVLGQPRGVGVGVDGSGQCRLESREVGASVAVLDRVGETVDLLLIAVVPLQRDLDALFATTAVAEIFEVDRLLVERVLVAVQVLDEALDAADVGERLLFADQTPRRVWERG